MKRTGVAVLGSTGSVGRAALDVISRLKDNFELTSIAARSSFRRLASQVLEYRPRRVALTDESSCPRLRRAVGSHIRIQCGPDALVELARAHDTDTVVMAMSGTDGLLPVLAALESGKRVALATKELLVGFGDTIIETARRGGGEVLPVDSELAAIHQCLAGRPADSVVRLILTASGGPFWRHGPPSRPRVNDVLRHPTWKMGRKITVDSATLMNKGLEVIEAVRLFGVDPAQVDVVIHPQSVVHGLVELADGSLIGQLSCPDMRLPIQYCLTYPRRAASPVRRLDLARLARLDFHAPDRSRFPCLGLAHRALRIGGCAPCVLVAADQVAVEAFLSGQIAFEMIPSVIDRTLSNSTSWPEAGGTSLKHLLAAQSRATVETHHIVSACGQIQPARERRE